MEDQAQGNSFSNDGSFMERFNKLQEENKPEASSAGSTAATKPVSTRPTPPFKSSLNRVYGVKKKNPFLAKPVKKGVTKALPEKVSIKKEEKEEKKESIPLSGSIGSAASGGGGGGLLQQQPDADDGGGGDTDQNAQSPSSSAVAAPVLTTGKKRKRSRWSDAPPIAPPVVPAPPIPPTALSGDDAAIAAVMASFSSVSPATTGAGGSGQQLTPAQLIQIQEQIEMNKMVAEIRAVTERSTMTVKKKDPMKPQYEYDSDEDTDGGTWEHKKRSLEMLATYDKAIELTERSKGKHHIGDFLPPEELEKFIEKVKAIKEGRNPDFSDYKEHQLTDSNVGFRLLRKAGWTEGEGLGEKGEGITAPINKGKTSFDQGGVGVEVPGELNMDDSAFDTYRKRMMLAYRFRPNPLNNPRRPYY